MEKLHKKSPFVHSKLLFIHFIACLLLIRCTPSSDVNDGPDIPGDGISFTLSQRTTTTPVENLTVSIGDITRGKTFVSITFGGAVVLENFISEGEKIPFFASRKPFVLECRELDNQLIGDDTGTFLLKRGGTGSGANSEEQKIEALLQKIAASDVIFIRNGDEYPAAEAAEHLRSKYESAKDKIKTCDQFVEGIATKSSVSGEDYKVKLKDGNVMTMKEWIQLKADK